MEVLWRQPRAVLSAPRRAAGATDLARDVGGGFGDTALLIPLAVALITINHLNATAVFAGAGLLYVVTGLYHRLPVPVQPLKAVSAIAISAGLGATGIAAAGLLIGALFVGLWATGLADRLRPAFTPPVVRGIQLAVGFLLARTAWEQMTRAHQFTFSIGGAEGAMIGAGVGVLVALAAWRRVAGVPFILVAAGVLLGLLFGRHGHSHVVPLGPQPLGLALPSGGAFATALWTLALPQLALSLGNSLMATPAAAVSYFGDRGRHLTPGRLALSMGVANLVVSPLGGMPMCHGAGGLTAHVRMGAYTGRSTVVYGVVLVSFALAAGAAAPALLALLPPALLAGLLLYVGVAHAALITDLRKRGDILLALLIGTISAVTGNITFGVAAGLACAAVAALLHRRRARATVPVP